MANDPERQKRLNEFYKQNFGYDFAALPPERVQAAAALIKKLRMAQVPFYTQKDGTIGNPERAALEQAGGIDPKEAEAMSIFAAWQRGAMPDELDRERLKREGMPEPEIDRAIGERSERWKQDIRREFDVFARREEQPEQKAAKGTESGAEGEKPAEQAQPEQAQPQEQTAERDRRARGVREGNRIRVVRS